MLEEIQIDLEKKLKIQKRFSVGPYYVRTDSTYQDVWMSFCAVTFNSDLKID